MDPFESLWQSLSLVAGEKEERHGRNGGAYPPRRQNHGNFSSLAEACPSRVASPPFSLSSSSSVVRPKLSVSEKKPPISAAPNTSSVGKSGGSSSSSRVSPGPSLPFSKASPSPLPSEIVNACQLEEIVNVAQLDPAPSKLYKVSRVANALSKMHNIFGLEDDSREIYNVSQLLHSPGFSPLSKASPHPSPFKFIKPDKRSPDTVKIEQRSRHEIPKHLEELIKNGIVPPVLREPLSPSTYSDYFAALLYAEDFYLEKWSKFLLSEVTLELRRDVASQIQKPREGKNTDMNANHVVRKDFVAFELDSIPERRPHLLSRDFVYVQPSDKTEGPFKGVLFREVKSTTALVEFGDDFYKQHSPSKKYDVSFSFNRVCLKRFHEAVSAAMDPLLRKILFPDPSSTTSFLKLSSSVILVHRSLSHGLLPVLNRVLNLEGPLPYLIEGPLSETPEGALSSTGAIIQEAVLQINRSCSHSRILVCAPRNRTCDELMKEWMSEIPKSKLFRANAAFRDYDLVPEDIIPACLYEGECFSCPSLSELQKFEVITSTFVTSFRLHTAGIEANHFTHIFLVDASSATEPETIVALANLVNSKTAIVITGSSKDSPSWVRSYTARMNGLKKSLFQRLLEIEPYSKKDPMLVAHVV